METIVDWCVGISFLIFVALGVTSCAKESKKPGFELKKAEWICSKEDIQTRFQATVMGNQTMMMPVTDVTCIEWKRKY